MRDDPADVRDILGMRTPFAWGLAGLFIITIFVMALTAREGIHHLWVTAAAAASISVAGVGLILAPGDPLPARFAVPIASITPLATALALWQLPTPMNNSTQIWFIGATSAYLNFMAIRSATAWAWAALVVQIGLCGTWTALTGQGALTGVGFSFISVAPLLMATFFGRVVGPMATAILSLRRQAADQAAREAAAIAAQTERDIRLARLDAAARPLLEAIATGRQLAAEQQQECGLVEAELRDEILGGLMVDAQVLVAARHARQRGVTVVLDDGGGLEQASDHLRSSVRAIVRDVLSQAREGMVVARVLPHGRDTIVSVLVRGGGTEQRIEVGVDGAVRPQPGIPGAGD